MKNKPIKTVLTAGIMLAALSMSIVAEETGDDAAAASRRFRASATSPIGNFVTNSDILVNSIKGNRLKDGTVPATKLASSIGLWSASLSGDVFRTTGKVGIGTSNPLSLLDVNGSMHVGNYAADGSPRLITFGDGGIVSIGENNVDDRMELSASNFVFNSGRVGIHTAPNATFHLDHTSSGLAFDNAVFISKNGGNAVVLVRTFVDAGPFNLELFEGDAFKPGGGAWSVVSDRRLKKNIEPLNGALDRLMKLRSVTYEYHEPEKIQQLPGTQTGFIAQEVEAVFPDWVGEKSDGMKYISVKGFESLTVQALREMRAEKDAQVANLRSENTALAAKVAALEATDKAREARLTRLESAIDAGPARVVRASLDLK